MRTLAKKRTLLLNKNWIVLKTITVERAVCLLFSTYKNGEPKAKVIEAVDPFTKFSEYTWQDWSKLRLKEGEDGIHCVNDIFRIPKVVKLTRCDRFPSDKIKFSRRAIYKRDEGRCMYCGKKVGNDWSLDHILAKSRGGLTIWENVCLSCFKCNLKKGSKTLEQCGMQLLKQPTKPKFNLFEEDFSSDISWQDFVDKAYWNIELKNDIK